MGQIKLETGEIDLELGQIVKKSGEIKLEPMEIVKESGEIKLESRGKNGTHTISYNYIGFIGFNYTPVWLMEIVQV